MNLPQIHVHQNCFMMTKRRPVVSAGHKGRLPGETRSACKGKRGGTVTPHRVWTQVHLYQESVLSCPLTLRWYLIHIQTFFFFLQNWKQRWFTLNRYELKYFKDKAVSPTWPRAQNALLHFHLALRIRVWDWSIWIRFHLLQITPDKQQEGVSWCKSVSVAVWGADPNPGSESLLCSPVRLLSGQSQLFLVSDARSVFRTGRLYQMWKYHVQTQEFWFGLENCQQVWHVLINVF